MWPSSSNVTAVLKQCSQGEQLPHLEPPTPGILRVIPESHQEAMRRMRRKVSVMDSTDGDRPATVTAKNAASWEC